MEENISDEPVEPSQRHEHLEKTRITPVIRKALERSGDPSGPLRRIKYLMIFDPPIPRRSHLSPKSKQYQMDAIVEEVREGCKGC